MGWAGLEPATNALKSVPTWRTDRSLSFADLKRHAYINDRARSADASEDFSELIRIGLPEPRP